MANEEHVRLLKEEGVDAWNQWRKENPGITPDLIEADLSGADLRGANLSSANLRGIVLREAKLGPISDEVDLTETEFTQFEIGALILGSHGLNKKGVFTWLFSMTDLSRADLVGADLSHADLRSANLREADLSFASVLGANLSGADLRSANLAKAQLSGGDLSRTDLSRANLSVSDLSRVDLVGANLSGADMTSAILHETVFIDTDLREAKGLAQCHHGGPSGVDMRTLRRSWPVPLDFLQGCGLSDWEIEAARLQQEDLSTTQVTDIGYRLIELRSDPAIQFHSCFISYSSRNEPFAKQLHDDLQDAGVRCWFAPKDIKTGDRFRDVIEDAVRLHDKVLLILSKDSIKSEWVGDEVETALEKEKRRRPKETVLFPLRIDDAVQRTRQAWAAKLRRQRHIGDFCQWKDHDAYQEAFQRLLRDLKTDKAPDPEKK